jgi:membrane protein DedA with SNARE-associated domain
MGGSTALVGHSGYLGLAVVVLVEGFGVPAPGETAIILAASLAGHGRLNVCPARPGRGRHGPVRGQAASAQRCRGRRHRHAVAAIPAFNAISAAAWMGVSTTGSYLVGDRIPAIEAALAATSGTP